MVVGLLSDGLNLSWRLRFVDCRTVDKRNFFIQIQQFINSISLFSFGFEFQQKVISFFFCLNTSNSDDFCSVFISQAERTTKFQNEPS